MRHRKAGRKFGMDGNERKAMLRNMVTSLFIHGQITTTTERAKELRRYAERLVTIAKRAPSADAASALTGEDGQKARAARVHAIRRAKRWLLSDVATRQLFDVYAPRFAARGGGYTRVIKAGFRAGDNAAMAIIEVVGDDAAAE